MKTRKHRIRFWSIGAMFFAALVATRKLLAVVDMSEVSFLASIGIRTLVINARAQSSPVLASNQKTQTCATSGTQTFRMIQDSMQLQHDGQ